MKLEIFICVILYDVCVQDRIWNRWGNCYGCDAKVESGVRWWPGTSDHKVRATCWTPTSILPEPKLFSGKF